MQRRGALIVATLAVCGVLGPLVVSQTATATAPFVSQVNFQKQTSAVPAGYIADWGQAYTNTGTFGDHGWVTSGTTHGVSIVGNGKARNRVLDERLDTLMVIKATAPAVPPQWIMYVPNGTYDVTVSAGDYLQAGVTNVKVNGTQAITNFKSTPQQLFERVTVQVNVTTSYIVLDTNPGAGKSTNARVNYVDIQQEVSPPPHTFSSIDPSVATVPPNPAGTGVSVSTSVTLATSDSVDPATISDDSIELFDVTTGNPVNGFFNTDAAGGVINFTPSSNLQPATIYEFETNLNLKGLDGVPFAELTIWFQTSPTPPPPPPANFDKVTFDTLQGPTALQIGPDHRLYVATAIGEIRRYDLDANGLPAGAPLVVDTYLNSSTITGLTFSDSGDPNAPNLWVSRGALCDQCPITSTGAISELTGANLGTARDVIVGLPRSYHDHMNNGIQFGPDGKLYIAQGAMTGYGAPDAYWGNRSETPLSASILVADVLNNPAFQGGPVNVDTNQGYDPTASGAPLTVCAQGLRNPFDLLFHSNGHMYSAVNESAGGNSPAGPGNNPPALTNLPPGPDYLDDVVCGPNSYYGHPNPTQGHYTLMGGNPDGGGEVWTWPQYPVGTQPDPNWIRPIYDIGNHRSPDGMAEYTSGQFNGKLQGDILVTDFSVGKDLVAYKLNSAGTAVVNATQLATGFNNPIGVATDASGRIYVAEFGTQPYGSPGGQITLLQPTPGVVRTPYQYVDFGPEATGPASGYLRDFGNPYADGTGSCTSDDASGCGLGWIDQGDTNPLSLVGNGVARTCSGVPDPRLLTYLAMQYNGTPAGGVQTPGRWQMEVPVGTYRVTASVGDCSRTDSVDELSVNGTELVHMFQPTGSNHFASGNAQIDVADTTGDGHGFITLDSAGGTNTKINYVNIDLVTFIAPDNTAPTVTLTPSGTLNTDGICYVGSVSVSASATDPDDGSATLQTSYAVDGGPFNQYTGPIQISGDGNHTLAVNSEDPAGNIGTASANYCIDSVVPTASFNTPDDFLGVGPRLTFSTVAGFDSSRPPRTATINNPSPKDLQVTNLSFSGTDAASFAVTSAPTLPFTIVSGGHQDVSIEFHPSELNPSDTSIQQYASFDVTTNNPITPTFSMPVAGIDAIGFEGGNEPNLTDITHVLGYTTQIPMNPGQTRLPAGDEVISPYWKAADSAQPVTLRPLAHYSTRYKTPLFQTGWGTQAAPKTITNLYSFPQNASDPYGGANQQTEPAFNGTTTFSPGTTAFNLSASGANSDDFYNGACRFHDARFFPAKDASGTPIAHTWIVGFDVNNACPINGKNFDYQDEVLLMSNADPLLPSAPAPNSSSLNLSFCNTYPGTVQDANGSGTGFTTVVPNTAGNQYDPTKLSLDNANCALHITTTSGTMTAKVNSQIDAISSNFDATRGTFSINGRLQAPFTQINTGHDHQALFWAVDQNNFMKLEVENNAGVPGLVVFFEQVTPKGTISNKIIGGPIDTTPSLATLTSSDYLDLSIHCDPSTASCTFFYSVDGAAPTQFTGTSGPIVAVPRFPMVFFNSDAYAGVLAANQTSPTPFVATYDSFSVTAP